MTSNQRNLTEFEIDYICEGTISELLGDKVDSFRQKLENIQLDPLYINDLKSYLRNEIYSQWFRSTNAHFIIGSYFSVSF